MNANHICVCRHTRSDHGHTRRCAVCTCDAFDWDSVAAMAKRGRPRTVSPEGGAKAPNLTVRATGEHRQELDAIVAEGHGPTHSDAVRYLIEQSAERRAERR